MKKCSQNLWNLIMSRMMSKLIRLRTPLGGCVVRYVNTNEFKLTEKDVEEVKIPVPWGHIAGKWWGNKDVPPIVAIHGWQENAGTFDNLIPFLNVPSVLAVDLPGHGKSSYLPTGVLYDIWELVITIHRIKKHFNWVQLPLLTHSYGSALGFAYAALFPDNVKFLLNIECVRCLLVLYKEEYSFNLATSVDEFLKAEKRNLIKLHRTYKLSKMIELCIEGSMGSVSSAQGAQVLLKRGSLPAEQHTEHTGKGLYSMETFFLNEKRLSKKMSKEKQEDIENFFVIAKGVLTAAKEDLKKHTVNEAAEKFYAFARDPCIRILIPQAWDEEFIIKASQSIKCPVLSVRTKQGFLIGTTKKLYEQSVEELKTHSPYAEHHDIDGKWWGSRDLQPIICLHGWQDNANTFDPLIPLLPSTFSYLAIDLPGHGFSSHLPSGVFYKTYECCITIRRVQRYFNLEKMSFIGHSLGGVCTFIFSSVFSNEVNFFVAIDAIKPYTEEIDFVLENFSKKIEKMLLNEMKIQSESPKYTKDDLTKAWVKATNNSLTEQSCHILIKRGTTESNGLYKLTRDIRLKETVSARFTDIEVLKMAQEITCSALYIKAKDGFKLQDEHKINHIVDVIKKRAKYFEQHNLPGTHHLHLNNPEVVAPVISAFIEHVTEQ